MQIRNNTDTEKSLYHDALWWVDATADTWAFADFIRSANFALDHAVRKILTVSGRWQFDDSNNEDLPIATTPLVANQDNYTIADSHLRIARLRVTDKNGDFKTLRPKDRRDLSDSFTTKTGVPEVYDKLGRSIFPFPIPDYSGTVEITYQRGSNYFTPDDTTKSPGFDSTFHRYVSLSPAREYALKYAPQRVNAIDTEIQRLDAELKEHYVTRDVDDAPQMTVERTTENY